MRDAPSLAEGELERNAGEVAHKLLVEYLLVDRLGQIVVRAVCSRRGYVFFRSIARKHYDFAVTVMILGKSSESAQSDEAVRTRHIDIQKDQVRLVIGEFHKRVLGIERLLEEPILTFDQSLNQFVYRQVVVDYQYLEFRHNARNRAVRVVYATCAQTSVKSNSIPLY